MNIVTVTSGGKVIVRPDTTWKRNIEDLYAPEFVTGFSFTPVLFARISRSGRSVEPKFAGRYYDGIGFGMLLYPEDMLDGSPEGFACASCMDRTTFLPFPVYNKVTLGRDNNRFELTSNGKRIFECTATQPSLLDNAVAEATKFVYIRTGDLLALELQQLSHLDIPSGKTEIRAEYCGNATMEFKVILEDNR